MSWRWPSQNTFRMWTALYWTWSSRTKFGLSINIWRLAGDTLNIACNFLYCNHQVRRDFLITLYKFGVAQSVASATLGRGPAAVRRYKKNCGISLLHDTETYLSLRLIQGWVVPPNMGISVPISIWISSNVHTTLRANLWFDLGSGRFSSGLGSGNGGQALQKQYKTIQNIIT
jgi:hypothetical protein